MELRRATIDDAPDVLAWRNDPVSVANSRTGAVDESAHLVWFPKAILEPRRVFLIAEIDGQKIGMIRFDSQGANWTVSINLAPESRGRGLGTELLRAGIELMGGYAIFAEIRESNAASIRLFEKCGFKHIGSDGEWLQYGR